ncbi:MAG TPA: response regulator [Ktedonobacteraceae bacterium]|nr:response regulator [Ktedonobacteraceae bacterium]
MDDSFNQNELSAEDLAILQAFDAMEMDDWETGSPGPETHDDITTSPLAEQDILSPDDMLSLFVGEVNEDITQIRRALQNLDMDETLDHGRLQVLQRAAHKIKGTAGAVGCMAMSHIAQYMEELIKVIIQGDVAPFVGLNVLMQTALALEVTLKSVVTYGHESTAPLTELEAEYKALNIVLGSDSQPSSVPHDDEELSQVRIAFKASWEEEGTSPAGSLKARQEQPSTAPFVRIDVRHFERLVLHSEQLTDLSAPLQNAQAEVEKSLQELHVAQTRLHQLENMLSNALSQNMQPDKGSTENEERSTSSLVARILHESALLSGHNYQRKGKKPTRSLQADESAHWDALEMDNYTKNDVLMHAFSEAIADVATASGQLRLAFDQLHRLTSKHIDQANNVRNDTLLLRLAPISTLLARIERAISMSASAQQRQKQFVVEGETTEIDQDILEELKHPLLQLVRTCLASSSEAAPSRGEDDTVADRIWLYARPVGNDVTIELGFSQAVGGGAIEGIQAALHRLHGSVSVDRNTEGGISFHLRLPRSQGAVQSLLVRVGDYRLLIPFSQVQRIDYGVQAGVQPALILGNLLGCADDQGTPEATYPVLVLQPGALERTVQVDEVLGEVELVVKPLAPHVQRPGIAGAAIDGMGNVLLMVDIFELIRHYERHQRVLRTNPLWHESTSTTEKMHPTVLIADDSVYIRRSLQQTLNHAGYRALEARDGMEALEILLSKPPQVLVLDLEMPNLNGYDLLSIMRGHAELAHVKIVMLTSRSSEKHKERAFELGAHAYLTKPCAPETLLEALKSLLTR